MSVRQPVLECRLKFAGSTTAELSGMFDSPVIQFTQDPPPLSERYARPPAPVTWELLPRTAAGWMDRLQCN